MLLLMIRGDETGLFQDDLFHLLSPGAFYLLGQALLLMQRRTFSSLSFTCSLTFFSCWEVLALSRAFSSLVCSVAQLHRFAAISFLRAALCTDSSLFIFLYSLWEFLRESSFFFNSFLILHHFSNDVLLWVMFDRDFFLPFFMWLINTNSSILTLNTHIKRVQSKFNCTPHILYNRAES